MNLNLIVISIFSLIFFSASDISQPLPSDHIISFNGLEENPEEELKNLIEQIKPDALGLIIAEPDESIILQLICKTLQDPRLGYTCELLPLRIYQYKQGVKQGGCTLLYSHVKRTLYIFNSIEELQEKSTRFIPPFLPNPYHSIFQDIFTENALEYLHGAIFVIPSKTLHLLFKK